MLICTSLTIKLTAGVGAGTTGCITSTASKEIKTVGLCVGFSRVPARIQKR